MSHAGHISESALKYTLPRDFGCAHESMINFLVDPNEAVWIFVHHSAHLQSLSVFAYSDVPIYLPICLNSKYLSGGKVKSAKLVPSQIPISAPIPPTSFATGPVYQT